MIARLAGPGSRPSAAARDAARWLRLMRPPIPRWLEVASHPLVASALLLAGLLSWQHDAVLLLAQRLASDLLAPTTLPSLAALSRPAVAAGVAAGLLPLAAIATWACYRLTLRLVAGGPVGPTRMTAPARRRSTRQGLEHVAADR